MCKNEEMLLLLSGHADGCNTPEEEARLQAHLAECPDCRRVLEEYEAMDAALAGLPLAMPENFTANVMRAVEAEPRKAEAKKPRRFTFGFATAAAAVAAIMLLAIGSGKLPIPGNTSARLNIFPSKSADSPAAEEYAAQEPASEPEAAPESVMVRAVASFSAAAAVPAIVCVKVFTPEIVSSPVLWTALPPSAAIEVLMSLSSDVCAAIVLSADVSRPRVSGSFSAPVSVHSPVLYVYVRIRRWEGMYTVTSVPDVNVSTWHILVAVYGMRSAPLSAEA